MKDKITSFAVLAFIVLCIYAAFIPENKTTPELFFTEADLDEIQGIANDRTRNYREILDDISELTN